MWLPEGGAFEGHWGSDSSPGSEPYTLSPLGSYSQQDKAERG